jgi:hypothetical protein
MIRRAVVAAVTGVILAAIGLATPAAAATPTCSGASCDGKVVTTTNCNDSRAYAIDGITAGSITLALWYSPSCHAMWGDYKLTGSGTAWMSMFGVAPYSGSGEARSLYSVNASGPTTDISTTLFNSIQSIEFCWNQQPGMPPADGSEGPYGCTRWR